MASNSKHIFIGIGGSGCQTIAQIKEKVYEKRFPNDEGGKTRLEAMNNSYRFIFLDTDQRDIDEANRRNRNSFEHGRVPFINPQTDLVNLGRANPLAIYYEAQHDKTETLINKRILEACSPELAAKIPDLPLAFGAGAFRMKSRIAFAHSLADFQSKLQAAISSLNDVKTVGGAGCTIFYWVVGSSVGGTGSGIFNDVLYHLNMLHHQIVGDGDPQLVFTMYMPKFYIDANATEEKYALNAYGVLQEVSAFKKMSYNPEQNTVMHRLAFLNDYNLVDSRRRYCPFYYMIPIDIQTDKGTSLGSTRTMYRNTAEMLYHLHDGQGGDTFRSDIDNYMNDIMEKDHSNFLVPMGYVSLQKPNEQFREYIRTRFRRDILQNWLLNDDAKNEEFSDAETKKLSKSFFSELNPDLPGTIASGIKKKDKDIREIFEDMSAVQGDNVKLEEQYALDKLSAPIDDFVNVVTKSETSYEKKSGYKKVVIAKMWKAAEEMIREKGLAYTVAALGKIQDATKKDYQEFNDSRKQQEEELNEAFRAVKEKFKKAEEYGFIETKRNQRNEIQEYFNAVTEYADNKENFALEFWKFDILKDFCEDDKNSEIAKLKNHLVRLMDKVSEMTAKSKKLYKELSNKFGNAALDVTTVYLPQLKDICDGNGWKADNFFSKCYRFMFDAKDDREETPERKILARFIDKVIYVTPDDETMVPEFKRGEYIVYPDDSNGSREKLVSNDYRFFANEKMIDRGPETIVSDFLTFAEIALDKEIRENKDIQDKWENRKISDFFNNLTNDQKDDVRRSLNPALFFSYNSSRIEVTKKEEHMVFVASNEEMASEMLGYEKGNPKHRFEPDSDKDKALVIKAKYGLALNDYRIYDSLKVVYDKATFREKYFFHHDFAQYQDQIKLSDLPIEELPQHRSFAKMLLLNMFMDEDLLGQFFYKDKYDPDNYVNKVYLENTQNADYFEIARAEAFKGLVDGKLCLCKEDCGRKLFDEISGVDFVQRFNSYCERYYNYRYGETLNKLLIAILQQKKDINQKIVTGEQVLKDNFKEKQPALLERLHQYIQNSKTHEERMIYMVLFQVVRERFATVQDFISNSK